jgi:Acyltransferase
MRRLRNDLPYTFHPVRVKNWLRPIGLAVNRSVHLTRKYRVKEISAEGFSQVRALSEAGHAVLLAPNHSDHSDPHVILELVAREGMRAVFMAARELFELNPVASWALQSMGAFSVDRDGPDFAAIKAAMSLLESGRDPLVIFPEGEIYHHHRRLDFLNEGVASILLKVAGRLPPAKSAFLVPVGLQFFHDTRVAETFCGRLSKLEDRIGWIPKPSMPVDDRIRRLGSGILALKETEYLGASGAGEFQQRLNQLCETLLTEVEMSYPLDVRAVSPPERVRALRYRIRRRLLDTENPPSGEVKHRLLNDLDRAFTALQAHSYMGDYLLADPTLDRRAEMVLKLEEDLFGFPTYPVDRTARVIAGKPIPVSEMLAQGTLPAKGGARALTELLEAKLRDLLV